MSDRAESRDFWSRRKAAVAAEQQVELAEDDVATVDEVKTDEELLEELCLPDPDDLVLGDDVSGFMSRAVPEHLRRRALRQLWRLNPVLANVDGLVDYGQDFTDSAMVVENMQTAYQVGKGMLQHVQEMARKAEIALGADNDDEVAEEVNEIIEDAPEDVEAVIVSSIDESDCHASDGVEEALVVRRRMRFSYDTPMEIAT